MFYSLDAINCVHQAFCDTLTFNLYLFLMRHYIIAFEHLFRGEFIAFFPFGLQ